MGNEQGKQMVIAVSPKNVGVAIILTVLFGPLGMFYSTITGAIIMIVVSLVVGVLTVGFGLVLTWPACIIWGAMAASAHNKKLMAGVQQQ
jgi:hypothetical protein